MSIWTILRPLLSGAKWERRAKALAKGPGTFAASELDALIGRTGHNAWRRRPRFRRR